MQYKKARNLCAPTLDPVAQHFRNFVEATDFPCVGAKSALNSGGLFFLRGRAITSAWNDVALHQAIVRFAHHHGSNLNGFRSLAIIFDGPLHLSEKAFEKHLWRRLQSWTDKDTWLGYEHDADVSSSPDSPEFSLSFGGHAFFAVGLHPRASRRARRFTRPVIVLNLHGQFEKLRAEGRYEKLRKSILLRDKRLQGSINPMLARFGSSSEAPQYSGRKVGVDWECPYRRYDKKDITKEQYDDN